MDRPPIKDRPGGLYRPGDTIGKLWELLSDGEWHSVKDLEAMFHPVNIKGRLSVLKLHGPAPVVPKNKAWSKTCNWRIEERNDQVKMSLSAI